MNFQRNFTSRSLSALPLSKNFQMFTKVSSKNHIDDRGSQFLTSREVKEAKNRIFSVKDIFQVLNVKKCCFVHQTRF